MARYLLSVTLSLTVSHFDVGHAVDWNGYLSNYF